MEKREGDRSALTKRGHVCVCVCVSALSVVLFASMGSGGQIYVSVTLLGFWVVSGIMEKNVQYLRGSYK